MAAPGEHELDDGVDHGALRLTAGGRGPAEPSRPAPAMPTARISPVSGRTAELSVPASAHGASSRHINIVVASSERRFMGAPSRAPLAPRLQFAERRG